MKNVLVILGTRPEAIKLAPVIHELNKFPEQFKTAVCATGQHSEMLYQAIQHFELTLEYDLKLMKKGQTLSELTAALISKLPKVLEVFCPDIILVQGDTTTAFVGALTGYYYQVEIGHVEAGLRTNNKFAPFPEEMNRRLTGKLTDHHFAPTQKAKESLLNEGVDQSNILITGNTVIDALFYTLKKNKKSLPSLGKLESVLANGHKKVLITGHRRENFGEGFFNICQAIQDLAQRFDNVDFIYPVHLNPNVQEPVYNILENKKNIHLIPPVGYTPFVRLMNEAHIILTDSGGIQEEAPSLGKPVLVMRDVTERPEAVEAGTSILVGTDKNKIFNEASKLLTDTDAWSAMSHIDNPFGDGKASQRIVDYLDKNQDR